MSNIVTEIRDKRLERREHLRGLIETGQAINTRGEALRWGVSGTTINGDLTSVRREIREREKRIAEAAAAERARSEGYQGHPANCRGLLCRSVRGELFAGRLSAKYVGG